MPDVDGRMRRIAAEWHGGQSKPTYAFVSTGTITQALRDEVGQLVWNADVTSHGETAIDELSELYDYLMAAVDRGPCEGWSDLWER